MTNSPAEVLAQWLYQQGYANEPPHATWPAFVNSLPDDDNNAICVYDTAGIPEGRIQQTGETIKKHGIQVRVRATDFQTGWQKADRICDAFDSLRMVTTTVDTVDYLIHAVSQRTTIIPLGPEEGNKRERFTVNFLATITEQ